MDSAALPSFGIAIEIRMLRPFVVCPSSSPDPGRTKFLNLKPSSLVLDLRALVNYQPRIVSLKPPHPQA